MVDWVRTGRVAWIFDENFVPDDIIAGANLNDEDPERLIAIAMKTYEPDFAEKVKPGDIFVGKDNYGYARAHVGVNVTLKALGIGGIVADSFAGEFQTRAANRAYPLVLECPGISEKVSRWDLLEVNFKTGLVKNLTKEEVIQGTPPPDDIIEMIEVGGQEPLLKRNLEASRQR